VLDAAVECGIRYFDTAPSYGSERVLGRGLRAVRNEIQLCTKVGIPGSTQNSASRARALLITAVRAVFSDAALSRVKQMRRAPMRTMATQRGYGNFDTSLIRSSVQQSLEKLETDRLDCLMLHEPRMSDPTQEVEQVLRESVRQGFVTRLGVGTGYQLDLRSSRLAIPEY
jgi:D-threo-aldose 1-dehydrogenase